AVFASHRSGRAPATDCLVLLHGPIFSVRQSEQTIVWLRTISRQNLDRRFHLHDVPGSLSDDQHPDERVTKTAGENRCASSLVQCRSGQRQTRSSARLLCEIASRSQALELSHWTQ